MASKGPETIQFVTMSGGVCHAETPSKCTVVGAREAIGAKLGCHPACVGLVDKTGAALRSDRRLRASRVVTVVLQKSYRLRCWSCDAWAECSCLSEGCRCTPAQDLKPVWCVACSAPSQRRRSPCVQRAVGSKKARQQRDASGEEQLADFSLVGS